MRKSYRSHLIVIGLYLLLTLWLTWPLAAHLTTHVPGEPTWAFDESTFLWNMWWFKYSLLDLGQTPLASTYIFFPLGIRLTTYTFNLFNAAFGLPLQLTFSLPLAGNLALIFSYISSAYGMFLLSLYLLQRPPTTDRRVRSLPVGPPDSQFIIHNSLFTIHNYFPAFAAGAVYAFSASRMMYAALGHYNFVTIQWFPFYTLFLLKTLRDGGRKNILLAALFAALCLYAELTFSVFLIFITLILWAGDLLSPRFLTSSLPRLLAIGLVTFILTAPFTFAILPDFLNPAYAEPGWGEGLKLSADLAGLVTPTPLSRLSGLDWQRELRAVIEGTSRFNDANTLFLGYGILALALLGIVLRWKEGKVWFWSALIFTILSLGPLLTINGQNQFNWDGLEVTLPLPFALLHYLPLISANRVPNRFGIPLTLSLAALVSYGLSGVRCWVSGVKLPASRLTLRPSLWLQGKLFHPSTLPLVAGQAASRFTLYASRFTLYASRFTLYVLLLILLLFDQYSVPLPLSDTRIPEVYYQIGAEPGDFSLMQLPLGWRNSYGTLGAEQTQLQYYQSVHRRPMLGGNTSRNPAFKFDYYAHIPLFYTLTETELYRNVDESIQQRARLQAAELMALYNIKYLVIHEPVPQRKPYEDTYFSTRKLALELIPHQPEPAYESPGVQAFAVKQAEIPNPLVLDFGDWRSDPYRGEGWAGNEEIFAATANWAAALEAQVFFPVRGRGDRRLSIQIAPFNYPTMPEQRVGFSLNKTPLADNFSLHEGWQTVELTLPEVYLKEGLNHLTLHFSQTAQPRQALPANTTIGQTGLYTPVDLEANSGPDFAFISVGFDRGQVDASAHRRGVNIAVVEPESGRVIAAKGFDTAANAYEAAALSQFIEEIAEGQIVIVATQGLEAAAFFKAETLAGLQSLGLNTGTLMPPFSAIGVKGAPAGTAQQTTAANAGTAYLRLGLSPDTRSLAAAVDKITISQPD